ncbi:GNAT family N-acetyltransferase [Thalassobacillus hwangdonensis]|uniref:GNAT family N-acetyltransferase n=1 Tax=Thalassobacillus hwangdonensis TaxID=546108 RepID=A0ABW3L2B6_9BACI
MEWIIKRFDELSTHELYKVLKLRVDVFVVEQECPYPELDGCDESSLHLWAREGERIIAYCRLVPGGGKYTYPSIGRVIVHPQHRGEGVSRMLMEKAMQVLQQEWGTEQIFLQGQEHLAGFYRSFGFKDISDSYLDDGIPHIDMLWEKGGR